MKTNDATQCCPTRFSDTDRERFEIVRRADRYPGATLLDENVRVSVGEGSLTFDKDMDAHRLLVVRDAEKTSITVSSGGVGQVHLDSFHGGYREWSVVSENGMLRAHYVPLAFGAVDVCIEGGDGSVNRRSDALGPACYVFATGHVLVRRGESDTFVVDDQGSGRREIIGQSVLDERFGPQCCFHSGYDIGVFDEVVDFFARAER